MLRKRLIPVLLILDGSLVKTRRFKNPEYIGDPVNSSRIFNELYADELLILDISETRRTYKEGINFELISNLASECFMPLTYGGKIKSVSDAKKIIRLGVEKVTLNSAALERQALIEEIAAELGSSSTVIAVDVKMNPLNRNYMVYRNAGRKRTSFLALDWITESIKRGAGEILLTDISREGTWKGVNEELIQLAEKISDVPVILAGGTSDYDEAARILKHRDISALGVGNLVCYQKKGCGVLVNYPDENFIE